MNNLHLIVHGKVQGVYYRKNTKEKADEIGISGTVKNLADGSVEIYAQGTQQQLATFLLWAHHGSPLSIVNRVVSKLSEESEDFKSFEILR